MYRIFLILIEINCVFFSWACLEISTFWCLIKTVLTLPEKTSHILFRYKNQIFWFRDMFYLTREGWPSLVYLFEHETVNAFDSCPIISWYMFYSWIHNRSDNLYFFKHLLVFTHAKLGCAHYSSRLNYYWWKSRQK